MVFELGFCSLRSLELDFHEFGWYESGFHGSGQFGSGFRGQHSCFCFECCSFPCCLFAQLWLRAPCYSRYSRLVVCCVLHVACVLYVACRASPVSRAARCVLPAGAQHVSSPLCISSRLLLCISDETVSRFRLFWQRIAVVNDFKEA